MSLVTQIGFKLYKSITEIAAINPILVEAEFNLITIYRIKSQEGGLWAYRIELGYMKSYTKSFMSKKFRGLAH